MAKSAGGRREPGQAPRAPCGNAAVDRVGDVNVNHAALVEHIGLVFELNELHVQVALHVEELWPVKPLAVACPRMDGGKQATSQR